MEYMARGGLRSPSTTLPLPLFFYLNAFDYLNLKQNIAADQNQYAKSIVDTDNVTTNMISIKLNVYI